MEFLRWVSLVLNDPHFHQADPTRHKEITAFTRFERRLGLKAGSPFDPAKLSPEITAAVEAGI